jgi:plasmid maintenance system antidote protein VapI
MQPQTSNYKIKFAVFKNKFYICIRKIANSNPIMDIASRLKQFLDYTGVQSTQFADTCGIPRPSFSQLLSGRNRKVSDEVISKIHEAYPQLSVLWLMFGEGEMVTSANIEISEPENEQNSPLQSMQYLDFEGETHTTNELKNCTNSLQSTQVPPLPGIISSDFATFDTNTTTQKAPAAKTTEHQTPDTPVRRVVSIMVFYSDKSFETFVPEKAH